MRLAEHLKEHEALDLEGYIVELVRKHRGGAGVGGSSASTGGPVTGVTSVAGTADQILVNGLTAAQTGAVTLSLPTNVLIDGYFHASNSSDLTAGEQTLLQGGDANFTWQMKAVVDGGTTGQATTFNTSLLASELGILGNAGLDNRVPYYVDDGFGNSVLTTSANLTFSGTTLVVTGTTVSSNYQVLMGQPDWDYAIPYFAPIGGTNDVMSQSSGLRYLSNHLTLSGYLDVAPSTDLSASSLEVIRFGSDPQVNLGGNPFRIRWSDSGSSPASALVFDDGNNYPVNLYTYGTVTAASFIGSHYLNSGTGDVWFSDASDFATTSSAFNFTTATGKLTLSTTGSGAGIVLGASANLYETSAAVLRTTGSLQVDTAFALGTTPSTTTRFQTSYAPGTYDAGTTTSHSFSASAQGNAAGNTNHRMVTMSLTLTGSNPFALMTAFQGDVNKNNSSTGEMRFFSANLRLNGTGNAATGHSFESIAVVTGTGNMTSYRGFNARTPTFSSSGVVVTGHGYYIENQGATGMTTANGMTIAAQSGATNNYAIASAAGNLHGFGTTTPGANVHTAGAISQASWTTNGLALRVAAATYTDTSTAAAGTAASAVGSSFGIVTLAATNAITVTDGSTVYIAGAAAAGTNVTLTRGYALWVDAGVVRLDGDVVVGANAVADSANFYVTGKVSMSGELEVNGDLNHDGTNVGFYGTAPTTKPTSTTDIRTALINLGLYTTGGASPLDLNGGKLTADEVEINGALNHDGSTVGFYGATPVAQSTGWAVSNVTSDKVFDANSTSIDELADVLGSLITYLISRGDLAA